MKEGLELLFVSATICGNNEQTTICLDGENGKCTGKGKEVEERVGAKGGTEGEKDESNFGYDPPLYDGKPPFWARWVFVLLAIDVLFT